MLWVGYKLITEPYHPPKENTSAEIPAPKQDYSEYKFKPSAEDDKYEVKKLATETKCDNHDYIIWKKQYLSNEHHHFQSDH